ncbi:S-adenosylmethionine-dependent methyltransferase [Shewanella oneidensis MR-1]|uniref:S-adenosylmethionine-dependent methyltransferase n=1 Tax=Shewanella oneidensis (strain ATCC 700550 / JCM 31522 / CIP 106686 / LMG 19005 / NCIMB 14063 / MR-1) TaxID=211586 RepID=Q8ED51_SHEON|nr:class I SAM-dependent methyltransferase [Shewanella oneidensis]AAN55933.1 S-adenosylmethionine-dependent methyltransferase [Shewanella oneidensis MR-1]MDX5999631.1 class I SAM-dependent methyltransferase [Shewanella oneidensis]MEE2028616.1 Ribosomal RNA large subunit methyltransferase I [Shewanella oneidensis]QKG97380.1 S-adenosylmethionine-dependent methyltransferase [Shewanella oneidensis MR-1]
MQGFIDALATIEVGEDAVRLFHGRGGHYAGCEHLCLDWFAPVLLLTSFIQLEEAELADCQQAITARWQALQPNRPLNLVYQYRCGGETFSQLLTGEVPEQHIVTENRAKFQVHLLRGQNHGLFLDMANGREWVRANARHKKILNLFAYTCGFSVAALQGGADEVVNMDMSKGALAIGKQNHLLNDFTAGARFLGHDIFKSWGKLRKLGPYDIVVADPPSNQKGSFVATKDYVRLIRHLPELLAENAEVLLCLNAPELDTQFLRQQVEEAAPALEYLERLPNPAAFADVSQEKSLKVLRYRLKA